jgi:V/A-type H+/Na+-transporting ATPase subunit I
MIVPMIKVYLAARQQDQAQLLEALGELGVIHLVPVDPQAALTDGQTLENAQNLRRALHELYGVVPAGQRPELDGPELDVVDAAGEVLQLERQLVEDGNRLAQLHHELEQMDVWGDFRLQQMEDLKQAGVDVQFHIIPAADLDQVQAECVAQVGSQPGNRVVVALASRGGMIQLPEAAVELPLPHHDASMIRKEAAHVEEGLKASRHRLAELAHLVPEMQQALPQWEREVEFHRARNGGLSDDRLFALQGWMPEESADSLPQRLQERNLPVAVKFLKPAEDELPPTLIRSPAWARPIEGLFSVLGTVAGYREFDVAVPFLIALPIFTAMLISDGGYGLVLLLALTLGYGKACALLGKQFTHLMIVVSVATLLWGLLCATFFGVRLYTPLIEVSLEESSRTFLMLLSFWMGAIHLSIAQLWPAVRMFPDQRFLNRVGWMIFIWGMLGVVLLFVLNWSFGWHTPWPYLLILGGLLAIGFAHPGASLGKRLLLGLADFPLSMLSAFSDVISYVRLMAVGLASSVLAESFNNMALSMISEGGGILQWPLLIIILFFGHSLNLGLAMIAMFAHGVRLNMLEFCNNLGMQWTGYQYHPFSQRTTQEYQT